MTTVESEALTRRVGAKPETPAGPVGGGPVASTAERDVTADPPVPNPGLDALQQELRGRLPDLMADVGRAFSAQWPDYSQFLDEGHEQVAQAGEMFLHHLVGTTLRGLQQLEPEPLGTEPIVQFVFEQIGREQWQQGDELTTLLTAYQLGAQLAWHHVSDAALHLGLAPELLAALAEAVFVFVNQLSAASAHGYVLEQSEASAARERLREELSELLLSDRSDESAVRAAAVRAGWALPEKAAVVLVDPDNEESRRIVASLGDASLAVRQGGLFGAITTDPEGPGRRERLVKALKGAGAVIGHPVPVNSLPSSTTIARTVLELKRDGLLTGDPIFAAEHLDMIIVHRDERLTSALRDQVLLPLRHLAPATAARLEDTLACWLRNLGDRQAIAEELSIHPQTVRYRLGQLREFFGGQLDDPVSRARMFLALVWGSPKKA